MSETQLSREQLRKKAKDESDKADLKQHADKIILAFENSSVNDAKRAIWELIQNARDLSREAQIEIVLEDNQLCFTHYGKTFDSNTLLSLVKQVSSKNRKKREQKAGDDEIKEVGQYGTGFLTTHSLGKRFLVDGTIELQDNQFVKLEGFEIDRRAKDSDELTGKLLIQQNKVFDLVEKGTIVSSNSPTTFRYQFELESDKKNANIAFSQTTESIFPFVMALNSHIKSISIVDKTANPCYSRTYTRLDSYLEDNLLVTPVQCDVQDPVNVYILPVDSELDLKIILPLSSSTTALLLPQYISRLFLYFPLIGSENWGNNFIVHCGLFNPHEKRDGIWIASDNAQNQEKEANNQEILQKSSNAIFAYLQKHCLRIQNPIHLAEVAFPTNSNDTLVDEYFKKLKQKWVSEMRGLPLVETSHGRKSPGECHFLSVELLAEKQVADEIYDLISLFWPLLPSKRLSENWTNTIVKWEDSKTNWISIENLCEKIQTSVHSSISVPLLQTFYSYLLRNSHDKCFEKFRLLPTYGNTLSIKRGLHKSTPLHSLFIEMAKIFTPKVPEQLVQDNFILQHTFNDYTRTELSKQLNPAIRDISSKLTIGKLLIEPQLNLLIRFCNSFPSLENKGARGDFMEQLLQFYNLMLPVEHIPNIGEDKIDYSAATECLIRHLIFDFATKAETDQDWVKHNLITIKNVLVIIINNKEYSAHLDKMPIFVNRNFSLITREQALIQNNIPEGLKKMYYDIFKNDKDDQLLHDDFEPFHKGGTILDGIQLSTEIMKFIEGHGPIEAINTHPDAKLIMRIIQQISEKDKQNADTWAKLFSAISTAKATIVMAKIVEEKTKESLFSIITIEDPEKISLLGDLAKDDQMIEIIEHGKKALYEQQSKEFDFEFKHKLGTHIEKLLHGLFGKELAQLGIEVKVLSEQGGKDIVIKKGDTVLFYIEVKSRWKSEYSIRMSKTQAETAVLNPEIYALVGVNMIDYHPEDGSRNIPSDINLIIDRVSILESIGTDIRPLISETMQRNKAEQEIHISPDYSVVIPQDVFKEKGLTFSIFLPRLSENLKKQIKM